MVMNKTKALYALNEEGNLTSREVKLNMNEDAFEYETYKDETIKIIPITRIKLRELFDDVSNISGLTGKEKDDKYDEVFNYRIILEHCILPKYTREELKYMKPAMVSCLIATILRESGLGKSMPTTEDVKQ